MTDDPYNDYYTHEALHTTFVLQDMLTRHVVETRCAEKFPDVLLAAQKAEQALADLYQIIGMKSEWDMG